ncbi:MBL fold metallo-hydrolase [Clostridium chromiireducens]|uniref:Metal-dependent hydrolase n=1 Tax=Clostridium chromiireducens TaxID=225345 RepID=A0A1V4IBP4_9CLOT|nr:MBL fold metallo-hydrolase [Clostridium chromiireducens]OPJ57411.1 metal-dependent hydrolase [Clostridium chromiireducens]
MQITWYGHSCFLIKTSMGKRILIDPFDSSLGYDNNFPKCDLITISNNHFDSSYINDLNLKTKVINETGEFDINFIKVEGINSFHDKYNGLKRGPNIIYIFNDNKYSLCHLGDLGHIPCVSILEKLKNVDILFIPIGGHFTLNGHEAAKLCKLISPKYIIPMHYKTNKTSLYLDDPKNFIISMKNIKKVHSNILDTTELGSDLKTNCILLTLP